ncbi:hypothetical protein ACFP2T_43725 [Plantactinospora solaniradicis]|uniref:Uncharacterized protein n=1 Tax=Plantactinospora solaniradicis TaxID=1723736 RepID=A0ABW1KQ06_9ACTN
MTTVQVLFFALGARRMRAVADESAQVVADGGQAVVLIDHAKLWRDVTFDPAVRVVELSGIEADQLPMRIGHGLLYDVPRGLFRAAGRGPLRQRARRAAAAYEFRLADRVHRRVLAPSYRLVWGEVSQSLVQRHVLDGASFDLVVVTDSPSMPYAARLLERYGASGWNPQVAFGLDYAAPDADSPAGSADSGRRG